MTLRNPIRLDRPTLGEKTQNIVIKYANQKDRPYSAFIKSRSIGIVVKPCMRVLDAALYIIVGLGKTLVALVIITPLQIGAKIIRKEFNSEWNIKESSLILGYGTLYTLDIFASPIINLINPNLYKWKFTVIRPEEQKPPEAINNPNPPVVAPDVLKEQLSEKENSLKEVQNELLKVQTEKEQLEARIKEISEKKDNDIEKQHLDDVNALNALRKDFEDLEKRKDDQINLSQAQINQLQNHEVELQNTLLKNAEDIRVLNQQIENVQNQLNTKERNLEALTQQLRTKDENIGSIVDQARKNAAQKEIEHRDALQLAVSERAIIILQLRNDLNILSASKRDLEERVNTLQQTIDRNALTIRDLQNQIAILNDNLQQKIAAHTLQLKTKDEQIASIEEQAKKNSSQQNEEHKNALQLLVSEKNRISIQLRKDLEAREKLLNDTLAQQKTMEEFFRSQIATQDAKLSSKAHELEKHKEQIQNVFELQAKKYEEKLNSLAAQHTLSQGLLSSEVAKLRSAKEESESLATTLAAKVRDLEAVNDVQATSLQGLEQKNNSFSHQVRHLSNRLKEVEQLNNQLTEYKEHSLDMIDKAAKAVKEAIAYKSDQNTLKMKHRAVGQFFLWLKNKSDAKTLKLTPNIEKKLPALQEAIKNNPQELSVTFLGEQVLSVCTDTFVDEDRNFLRQCYKDFILEQINSGQHAKIIELGQQDMEDLLNLICKPLLQSQVGKPLEEVVALSPEENKNALEEMEKSELKPSFPDASKVAADELTLSQIDGFVSLGYKKADYESLINYELIRDLPEAKVGVSIVNINDVKWLQYIRSTKEEIKGIRYRFSDVFLETYDQLLEMNDHSYAAANAFTKKDPVKLKNIDIRHERLNKEFDALNWCDTVYALGSMGRDNVDPDVPCVMRHNPIKKLIVITFHGSRNGSKNPVFHDGKGDWGANFDDEAVSPSKIKLDIRSNVKVHRGFALNVQSVQENIQNYLSTVLLKVLPEARSKYRVIFTGHSKGASEASIGALLGKEYLEKQAIPARVSAVLFSSPRSFFGDESQMMVDKLLGVANIVRIQVYGDPVANVPIRWNGARSSGLLILDDVNKARERLIKVAPQLQDQNLKVRIIGKLAPYHYGSSMRGAGMEFDPRIVVRNPDELMEAFKVGLEHTINKGENPIARCPIE